MWLVLNKGYLSIVNKEGSLVIRARDRKHLEYYFPDYPIEQSELSDYEFRIRITKEEFSKFLFSLSETIDYSNFKDSVKENSLKKFCEQVWYIGYKTLGRPLMTFL